MILRWLTIISIVVAPLAVLAGALYEIVTGKITEPLFYVLLVAFPGALAASIKALKESDLLAPERLVFEVNTKGVTCTKWEQLIPGVDQTREVLDIDIPLRIENPDNKKTISIRGVQVASTDPNVKLGAPGTVKIDKEWLWKVGNSAYPELFNDGSQKRLEARQIGEYHVGVCEYGRARQRYEIGIGFSDNWGRTYSETVHVQLS